MRRADANDDDDDDAATWPTWLQRLSSDAFRRAHRRGAVPQFSWYVPQLLPRPRQRHEEGDGEEQQQQQQHNDKRDVRGDHGGFFSLTHTVLSERLDGVLRHDNSDNNNGGDDNDDDVAMTPRQRRARDEAVLRERRVAYGVAWECATPIEALWDGAPVNSRLPPAVDYERLLLQQQVSTMTRTVVRTQCKGRHGNGSSAAVVRAHMHAQAPPPQQQRRIDDDDDDDDDSRRDETMTTTSSSSSYRRADTRVLPAPALQTFALWYAQQLPHAEHTAMASVLTAAQFAQRARDDYGRNAESQLWSLIDDVLSDAARAAHYDARAIANLAQLPPHRRWFVSQFAHVQYLLQTHTLARRATILCGWLERVQRQSLARTPAAPLVGDDKALLRQLLFAYVRAGQLSHAVAAATRAGASVYSCILGATQLQTAREAWFAHTALVPLFGEYSTSGSEVVERAWCGNEQRLDSLAQLYEESLRADVASRCGRSSNSNSSNSSNSSSSAADALIAAALCGNIDVLERAYATSAVADWRDVTWAYLRCALVLVFTRTLMDARHDGVDDNSSSSSGYAAYVRHTTSPRHDDDDDGSDGDDWVDAFMRRVVRKLTRRLCNDYLHHGVSSSSSSQQRRQQRPSLCLVDELSMRFVLHMLNSEGDDNGSSRSVVDDTEWFALAPLPAPSLTQRVYTSRDGSSSSSMRRPLQSCRDDAMCNEDEHDEAVRLVTHTLLVLDAAYHDTLLTHAIQVRAGHVLARALACYADALATHTCTTTATATATASTLSPEAGMAAMMAMARRLREPAQRAAVYAAYVRRARVCALHAHAHTHVVDDVDGGNAASPAPQRVVAEEREARLVRLVLDTDNVAEVADELQRLLCSDAASLLTSSASSSLPDALPLLTRSAEADEVMCGAMHARNAAERVAVVRRGLQVCMQSWLRATTTTSSAHAAHDDEEEAAVAAAVEVIADVSAILARRVLPPLAANSPDAVPHHDDNNDNDSDDNDDSNDGEATTTTTTLTTYELSEVAFWQLFTELRGVARAHARVAGELSAARATADTNNNNNNSQRGRRLHDASRTLLFQLAHDEARLLRRLQLLTRRALRHGGSLVHHARACVTAVVGVVQQCVDAVTLSFLCADAAPSRELRALQRVMRLLAEMDGAGYLHDALLPQQSAAALYARVRAMRVAYSLRAHTRRVQHDGGGDKDDDDDVAQAMLSDA